MAGEKCNLLRASTFQGEDRVSKILSIGAAADLGDTGQLPQLVRQRVGSHPPRLTDLGRPAEGCGPPQSGACPFSFTTHPCDRRPHEIQRRNTDPSLQLTL